MAFLQGSLGITVLVAIAWLLSEDRRSVQPRLIVGGLALQLVLAVLLLKLPAVKGLFIWLNDMVVALQKAPKPGPGSSSATWEAARPRLRSAIPRGIMIGGLGAMVPERRPEVVALGMKSTLAGTLATLMTGAVAGMIL